MHTSCAVLLTASPPFVAAIVPSNSTVPPPNRIRFSVTFVGIQSFFGYGFFNAGVCDDTWFYDFIGNSMIRGLGNRRLCMSMVRGMGLHRIKNSEV